MNRRRFFQVLLTFLGTITLFSFVSAFVKYLIALPSRSRPAGTITVRKAEIPFNEAKHLVLNNMPIIVINHADQGLLAFSRVCTHLGCLVEYSRSKQRLVCPCHGGTFGLDGAVISGPPPRPLPAVPIKIDGERIILG